MGGRERTGTSGCQVSEAPGAQFSSRLLLPIRMRRLQLFPQGALDVGHGLLGSRVGEAARGIPQLAELGGLLMT
jgi:hypothetical protein